MSFLTGTRILEDIESPINGHIQVIRDLTWGTYIQVGGLTQSGGILTAVWKETLKNLKINPGNILILGLGGGSVGKLAYKLWPDAKITGVDIDPVMVDMGKKYLGLDENKIQVKITDAFSYKAREKYDLILIDLYLGDEFPEKFEDEKFLRNIKSMLNLTSPRLRGTASVAIFNRLYGADKRVDSMNFGKKLEKVFRKVDYVFPQANLMLLCYN